MDDSIRSAVITQVKRLVEKEMMGPRQSAALGSMHLYGLDHQQLVEKAIIGGLLQCQGEDGVWDYKVHTPEQARQVLTEISTKYDNAKRILSKFTSDSEGNLVTAISSLTGDAKTAGFTALEDELNKFLSSNKEEPVVEGSAPVGKASKPS